MALSLSYFRLVSHPHDPLVCLVILLVWGLDFGDCHKSLHAHDGSVMSLSFLPATHYVISSSKDGTIKYWDADKFIHILTLHRHHSEVWGVAVSLDGTFLVSGSHDRSIRIWQQTTTPVFVEEEEERRLEKEWEDSLVDDGKYVCWIHAIINLEDDSVEAMFGYVLC